MTTPEDTANLPLLAIETSVPTARVAVIDGQGRVLAHREKTAARHSSNLLRLCDEALAEAGLSVRDLGSIACGGGPGSFTGLRVGLAVAKGLAFPLHLPLVLVPSLEALALDLVGPQMAGVSTTEEWLLPCLDAGKDEVYVQAFRWDGAVVSPLQEPPLALKPHDVMAYLRGLSATGSPAAAPGWRLGGTGADRYSEAFSPVAGVIWQPAAPGPSAQSVGVLARHRLREGRTDDLRTAVPVYGRPPDITKPKPKAPPAAP